ncbi:hypothetical protein NDN08_004859 [Rhodosorus marinus]|uniref:Sulfatase N-terminal domain-containing protein n=1 Tax=Rhodosorus marinus TaxID=101924 RepID=A0AAV8UIJ3_9RHOD|nr:hypothetical protein NDN08_004859 [Rhodosorus marinus]
MEQGVIVLRGRPAEWVKLFFFEDEEDCWIWLVLFGWFAALGPGEAFEGKPNVILIVLDDLGYHDLGIQGSEDVKSPNIDKLATDGVRFTDGFAPNHFCGPSRSGLFSGTYPFRIGAAFNTPKDYCDKTVGLPVDVEILPKTMKKAGYRTYCVGKWHLGHTTDHHPKNRGFDGFFGFLGDSWNYTLSEMYDEELDDLTCTGDSSELQALPTPPMILRTPLSRIYRNRGGLRNLSSFT